MPRLPSRITLIGAGFIATALAVVVPLAESRLGLRLPQDSEIVILRSPRPR